MQIIKSLFFTAVFTFCSLVVFAQVKRSTVAQTTIKQAEFVLEQVINVNNLDTTRNINITFNDEGKASSKSRVFISIPIEKSKTTYLKMINNFKAAAEYQSAEYSKTWENDYYQLKASTKPIYRFSKPDKNTQGDLGYINFSKEELLQIIAWLEGLRL